MIYVAQLRLTQYYMSIISQQYWKELNKYIFVFYLPFVLFSFNLHL